MLQLYKWTSPSGTKEVKIKDGIHLPAYTTLTRPTMTGSDKGVQIFNDDTKLIEYWDGTNWKPLNAVSNWQSLSSAGIIPSIAGYDSYGGFIMQDLQNKIAFVTYSISYATTPLIVGTNIINGSDLLSNLPNADAGFQSFFIGSANQSFNSKFVAYQHFIIGNTMAIGYGVATGLPASLDGFDGSFFYKLA